MKGRTATSRDVTAATGVSRATVSAVLSGARGNIRVSDSTRQRVLVAAQQLGYTPHYLAQALRRQPSRIIGFVPRRDRVSPDEMSIPFLLLSPLTSVTQPLTAVAKQAMIG